MCKKRKFFQYKCRTSLKKDLFFFSQVKAFVYLPSKLLHHFIVVSSNAVPFNAQTSDKLAIIGLDWDESAFVYFPIFTSSHLVNPLWLWDCGCQCTRTAAERIITLHLLPSLSYCFYSGQLGLRVVFSLKNFSICSVRYMGSKKERVGIRGQTSFWCTTDFDVSSVAGKNENMNLKCKPYFSNSSLRPMLPTMLGHNLRFPFSALPSCSCGNWRSSAPILAAFSSLWYAETV